jgi:V8-like Glu-specific endopeptidase
MKKSFAPILALPLALSLMACGSQRSSALLDQGGSSANIVAGTSVDKNDPIAHSTVALVFETATGSESVCTGTLIDTNIILTAAHCFITQPGDSLAGIGVAFVGAFGEINQTNILGAVDVAVNPQFGPQEAGKGTWNDVALIKFEGTLPAGYKPVPYLKDLTKLKAGMSLTIAGFGMTSPKGDDAPPEEQSIGTLMKAQVKLADAAYNGGELMTNTSESPASTCKGDSGGPAYAEIDGQLTVVGVTSRGTSQRCDNLSIFTSTAFQASFITTSVTKLK